MCHVKIKKGFGMLCSKNKGDQNKRCRNEAALNLNRSFGSVKTCSKFWIPGAAHQSDYSHLAIKQLNIFHIPVNLRLHIPQSSLSVLTLHMQDDDQRMMKHGHPPQKVCYCFLVEGA